jgi:uncharacterized membrane protein
LIERLVAAVRQLSGLPGLGVLQNFHPLVVHYQMALLSGAAAIYAISWATRRELWAWTGLWMLGLGTLGAALSVWTGLRAGESVMLAPTVRDRILAHHKHYMLAAFGLSVVLSAWALVERPMPRRGRLAFFTLLLLMVALIAKGADFGAWMVYGYNAGGSLPQPIEFSQ